MTHTRPETLFYPPKMPFTGNVPWTIQLLNFEFKENSTHRIFARIFFLFKEKVLPMIECLYHILIDYSITYLPVNLFINLCSHLVSRGQKIQNFDHIEEHILPICLYIYLMLFNILLDSISIFKFSIRNIYFSFSYNFLTYSKMVKFDPSLFGI